MIPPPEVSGTATHGVEALDLSSCEREPIHRPDAVEPNGVMLVVGEPGLEILQASSNSLPMLGLAPTALLGMRLADVFCIHDVRRLVPGPGVDGTRHYASGLRRAGSAIRVDALVHRNKGLLIVELEPPANPEQSAAARDIYESLTDTMAELDGSLPLVDLCARAAIRIRQLTGFDRVMVYRFLQDDSGCVIAEDRREELTPYLGLRYPASDIPPQARRLYLINMIRLKADVEAPNAFLIPALNPVTGNPLDMTFCILRSMSPIHIEYLRNMGVAASMSISILKDGKLWGLFACHHCSAILLPHSTRVTCEVLARVFSSYIASAEENDDRTRVTALHALTDRIGTKLRGDRDAGKALSEVADDISSVIGASGSLLIIRGNLVLSGATPNRNQVEALLNWLGTQQQEYVFATERLAALYPMAEDFSSLASGLLSVRLAIGGSDFIAWFRPSIVKIVAWGGILKSRSMTPGRGLVRDVHLSSGSRPTGTVQNRGPARNKILRQGFGL